MVSKDVEEEIRKAALKNALDYGKARDSTVINTVLSGFPELRADIRELAWAVNKEVSRINSLGKEELEKEAGAYRKEFEEKEREKAIRTAKPKMELEGAQKGHFATRFPPEPNGYMHIGHAKPVFMEREFADIYEGGLFLYFDDTNPEAERQEYVEAFKKDLEWLGIRFDGEYYASDNIERMYSYAATLIKNGNAYVCLCPVEQVKENRSTGKECVHKKQTSAENLRLWNEMIKKERDTGILRYNGNLKDLNTAMRDPTLFRIKAETHYRQGAKYSVWPTYDFNTPIMDSMKGVTDAMRSKEYELRDELYYKILDLLGLRKPRVHSFARLEIKDNITSKRKLKEFINSGNISGFDDPRLVTIASLRRRGILPEAIREFVLRFGMSKTNSQVGIDMLLAENRKLIDSRAVRMFFIERPRKLSVGGIPAEARKIRMKAHPSEDLGFREYEVGSEFFINSHDAISLKKGSLARLKDAFNIRILEPGGDTIKAEYVEGKGNDLLKLQWVSEGNYVDGKAISIGNLLSGDGFNKKSMVVTDGYIEGYASELKIGDIVQFEKIGFFKLDDRKEMTFISM